MYNTNSDITIRENISINDLYIGQYIQACGNIDCIYRITKINLEKSTINIFSAFKIMRRGDAHNMVDTGCFRLGKISKSEYTIDVDELIDTIYSARLNRLNQLDKLLGKEIQK